MGGSNPIRIQSMTNTSTQDTDAFVAQAKRTHNMKDAIVHGNRLIMMHEGRVILNIAGEEKKKLTVEDLLHQFEKVSGEEFANDKALLS